MGFEGFGGAATSCAPLAHEVARSRDRTTRRCTGRDDTRLRRVQHPSNLKLGRDPPPRAVLGRPPSAPAAGSLRTFLRVHGRKLWWLHSAYALGIGAGVVTFA